jgi:hypothetical protein
MTVERADSPRQNLRGAGGGSPQRGPRDGARLSRTGRRASPGGVLGLLAVLLLAGGAAAYVWTRTSRAGGATAGRGAPRAVGAGARCGRGTKICGDRCCALDAPEHGCGADTCEPCNLDHASARCDPTLRCTVETCYRSFADCDRNPTNGCETDLRVDADHCGRCNAACPPLEHAERGCGGGCTIWRCARGFRDCNDKVADGCEVDVTSDARHCGRCGHACPGGKPCEHGRCV